MVAIYSMFVVSKSGGLIFNKVRRCRGPLRRQARVVGGHPPTRFWLALWLAQDFAEVSRVDLNDLLRLASIW